MNKKINLFIVHFNTPELTKCLIKSINKQIPGNIDVRIYIWDNSDKEPFVYRQDNITYIDNTKKQLIDFDAWLATYKNHEKICYSAKHCYTVQRFMDKYGIPFILLDSDVLLKKDISCLFDEKFGFIGTASSGSNRVFPFLCFINPGLLKKYGVSYFNENKMLGLTPGSQRKWDTGSLLFDAIKTVPNKNINYKNYIEHYAAGSYDVKVFNLLHKGQISKKDWLEKNRIYWYEEPEKPKPSPEEKVMPVEKKKEAEVKYLKMAKTSDRKIGTIRK